MEYFIVVLASLLAGVSTGLVGLSAATVMVPFLVVFCPSFQGEHGAFMAIAIALASDVLGSAVASITYAKNKNIDLKHSLIMVICIISMCAVGSILAFFVHQAVLGTFSLVMCILIGVRFLAMPKSKNRNVIAKSSKLNLLQIILSLFFGIAIGFGTGFFGTGGGMMMLIIFTLVLKFDRKTAVGTSTFIMTFTALIASITHIIMEPTIILECWPFLIISIAVSTIASYLSAKFANKVKEEIVSYFTGGLLFALGIILMFFNFYSYIEEAYLLNYVQVLAIYIAFIVLLTLILILVRRFTTIKDYIFRKLLHMVAVFSIFPLVILSTHYLVSLAVIGTLMLIVFTALLVLEPLPFYKHLFVEKYKHEVVISFMILFAMFALMIFLFWGLLGKDYTYIIYASILSWGIGDAFAAIIGISFGKPRLHGKLIEGNKSIAGCVAMFIASFISSSIVLIFFSPYVWYFAILISFGVGLIATVIELFTRFGLDTISVPIFVALFLFLISLI